MKKEQIEFETFQALEGIKLTEDLVKLPGYDIFQFNFWETYITSNLDNTQKWMYDALVKNLGKTGVVLGIKVKAEDSKEATEKARVLSERFEYAMYYIIADLNFHYSIGTKNIRKSQFTTILTYNANGIGFGNKTEVFHRDYDLISHNILKESLGYNYLWEIIGKTQPNNLQKRITTAVEWIGKALWERDKIKTFIQLIIALESLLQFQEKSIISSSVANQISEWSAFIYSDKPEERISTYKKVKSLYEIRSKIVHSGKSTLDENDIYEALVLIKNIIVRLCVNSEYKKLDSIEQLNLVIAEKRFT